ncbi:hypothetical protein BDQ12DRAFT_95137 [Crucibulum laeve]|uniref:Uncharacterized protein n=1 Tax=Crucibulum laeve TaxID=68775 RepID=A0A5C3M0E9_9AGAR|nr:hypothetical protein BDQ12DRAFT_95137 [Crucibulum laeve]
MPGESRVSCAIIPCFLCPSYTSCSALPLAPNGPAFSFHSTIHPIPSPILFIVYCAASCCCYYLGVFYICTWGAGLSIDHITYTVMLPSITYIYIPLP